MFDPRILLPCLLVLLSATSLPAEQLPGTQPLTMEGDIAATMVSGADQFLLRKISQSLDQRDQFWHRDFASPAAYNQSIEPNRQRLAHILGVRGERTSFEALELVATTSQSHLVGKGTGYQVFAVRWPVMRNVHGEGLLLVPDTPAVADIIALPDADQTPEMICGLQTGVDKDSQFARRLAESGCRVLVPTLISREVHKHGGRAELTNREYLYRSGFELGHHLIGYEVQKVLAGVDWFERESQRESTKDGLNAKIGVVGYGEGGMLAFYAGALDRRIDATCVGGYFGPRETIWQQPISRNVFGLLEQFGDAELALMVAPRHLVVQHSVHPNVQISGSSAAPAVISTPPLAEVERERDRVRAVLAADTAESFSIFTLISSDGDPGKLISADALNSLLSALQPKLGDPIEKAGRGFGGVPTDTLSIAIANHADAEVVGRGVDVADRQARQVTEIEQHNQWLLSESPYVRRGFMNIGLTAYDKPDGSNQLDTSSAEAYRKSVERFRDDFRQHVIGDFQQQRLPFNARSRKLHDQPQYTTHEVMLDVFPDVFAYGILCVPKGIAAGEQRPVVVCQHGLEGRPMDVVSGDHYAYHDFATKLAERGYITFAPQNLYIGKDDFRTLQRKSNSIKKTLFSIIVPQHQQIVDWLKTQPHVDSQRIAFYGLSYGGKSAMRIPPLVPDYCLSICSADFNEWVGKNASTRSPYSYVWTGEYEIFEFDLGSTFNYAEMAALIAPRPFMVERGHFDGVGSDEDVAYEFAKVRHLYAARLGIPQNCEIEFFVGPHTIHGQGTFEFLDKHLK